MPVEDARYRTKVFLDTYLTAANLLIDDGATQAVFMTAFGNPSYSIVRVFIDKDVDLVYSIGEPDSIPLIGTDLATWGYQEFVPIATFCIDKDGITGEKLKFTAEKELRRICEANIFGSIRHLKNRTPNDYDVGGTKVYSTKWIMDYRRDTT